MYSYNKETNETHELKILLMYFFNDQIIWVILFYSSVLLLYVNDYIISLEEV